MSSVQAVTFSSADRSLSYAADVAPSSARRDVLMERGIREEELFGVARGWYASGRVSSASDFISWSSEGGTTGEDVIMGSSSW